MEPEYFCSIKLKKSIMMKQFVLCLILMTVAQWMMASAPDDSVISNRILTEIPYPSFAAENRETGVVHLVFCIGTDGKVMVKQISGDNDFLMGYVEKKLGQILFEPQTETSKEYTISLDFRLK